MAFAALVRRHVVVHRRDERLRIRREERARAEWLDSQQRLAAARAASRAARQHQQQTLSAARAAIEHQQSCVESISAACTPLHRLVVIGGD